MHKGRKLFRSNYTSPSVPLRKGGRESVSSILLAAALAVLVAILSPVGAICEDSGETLTTTIAELKAKAGAGMVRVIAKVRPDPHAALPTNAEETERALARSQAALVDALRREGAAVAEPIIGQPLVVLELTAPQLDRLMVPGLVESIEEDQKGRAFSK